jgi:hypothetical protein
MATSRLTTVVPTVSTNESRSAESTPNSGDVSAA